MFICKKKIALMTCPLENCKTNENKWGFCGLETRVIIKENNDFNFMITNGTFIWSTMYLIIIKNIQTLIQSNNSSDFYYKEFWQ